MALKGTLKDFGIADILQLIGQQQKTGTLVLRSKDQEVQIGFKDGNIVKAEGLNRKRKDLIGAMLVRAEIITEEQLEESLEIQRRTLKRLGDVLVASKALTAERFHQMVQLQMTETLYRLFSWKSGTYLFEQGEVDFDAKAAHPLRAESVLMEGFRMIDEWPEIKRKISRYDLTFEKVKDLPDATPSGEDDFDAAFDDAFSEEKKDEKKGDFASLGRAERTLHGLVMPGRDVRKLIDLSCLGEFETCKALLNLVNLDYLRAIEPEGKGQALGGEVSFLERVGGAAGRVLVTMLVLIAVGVAATQIHVGTAGFSRSSIASVEDPAAQRFISRSQLGRIRSALEVYRLEEGGVPQSLGALVKAGLLYPDDLRYPWHDPYFYRRVSASDFILLPPLR